MPLQAVRVKVLFDPLVAWPAQDMDKPASCCQMMARAHRELFQVSIITEYELSLLTKLIEWGVYCV
jgi:hypothetical protein